MRFQNISSKKNVVFRHTFRTLLTLIQQMINQNKIKKDMTDKELRILKALKNNKTTIAISYIKPDFSNIDEVYTNNLNVWYINYSDIRPTTKDGKGIEITNGILLNPDNVILSKTIGGFELTEIDFINSELKLLNECTNLNPIETKQSEYYKDYLNKKKINTEWTLNDYYNRYIDTKQFYNFFTNKIYKNHEYNNVKDHLNATNERFKYILNRLNTEDKKELINDYKDQLAQLKSKQTQSKFIELINETIQDIDVTPQQVESAIADEVKKELHNRIFKGNAFEVWQSMFEKFNINKSKRTDIDFMFEVMKYNNQIHTNIGYKDIEDWINEVYEIVFDRIKFTDTKTKANEKRLIIYNEINENQM